MTVPAATTLQPTETLEKVANSAATNGADVAAENTLNAAETLNCSVVAAETPESGVTNEIVLNAEPSAPAPDDDDIERESIMNEEYFNG